MMSAFTTAIIYVIFSLIGCLLPTSSVVPLEYEDQDADDSFLTTIMYLGQGQK